MQSVAKIVVTILIIAIQCRHILNVVKVWRSDFDIGQIISRQFAFVETKKELISPEPCSAFKLQ